MIIACLALVVSFYYRNRASLITCPTTTLPATQDCDPYHANYGPIITPGQTLRSDMFNYSLPEGISPNQIIATYWFEDSPGQHTYFALFQKEAMNNFSGVTGGRAGLLFKPGAAMEKSPYILAEIIDQSETHNNPFYFWQEGGDLYFLIIDSSGAGSGEGMAKVLKSSDQGKSWHTTSCFYYVPEPFYCSVAYDLNYQHLSVNSAITNYLNFMESRLTSPAATYDPQTKTFFTQDEQGKKYPEPACTNFTIKTY